ncbi:MAG: adenine phosphoribosyltransferase, partial [Thermoplasmata archaeon]
ISLKLRKPFTIIRKREYGLPGEISVEQVTGYSKSKLFINGLEKGDKIAIVDDVLSTGGTLRAVLKALREKDIDVRIVVIAIDKGTTAREIEKEFGVPVVSLASIEVGENETIIKSIKV